MDEGGLAVNGEAGDIGHRTQAQRSQRTRSALLAAARELFAERGYAGTGREQIAARAGVTRGALYHHFDGKLAVFEAVYESVEADVLTTIATAAMQSPIPADELRLGCHAFLDAALEPAVQRIVLLDGPAVLPVEVRDRIEAAHAAGLLRANVGELIATGVLPDVPVEALVAILLGALNAAAQFVARAADPRRARLDAGAALDRLLDSLLRSV